MRFGKEVWSYVVIYPQTVVHSFFQIMFGLYVYPGRCFHVCIRGWMLIVNGSFKSFNWLKLMNQFISDFETGKIDKKMKTLDT